MDRQLIFRSATGKDARRLRVLVTGIMEEFNLNTPLSDIEEIEEHYQKRGGAFQVLESTEGLIVGSFGLYPVDEHTCELRRMYLLPSMRGQGLGKTLLDQALVTARSLDFSRMILETSSEMKIAITMYEGYGFKAYKPQEFTYSCNRAYYLDLN